MSLYTHWACLSCRKSFRHFPLTSSQIESTQEIRKCPDCGQGMYDFGIYFQPPRRQALKAWKVMKLLADNGYKFQTEGGAVFIRVYVLSGRCSPKQLRLYIECKKQSQAETQIKAKLKLQKQEKRRQKRSRNQKSI